MTENKPIIIDGVDVSGCNLYFNKCQHKCEGVFDCYKKPNCYFKQLTRKTQECEELKKVVELLKQYKGSKQASYERMQIEWNKAVLQNRDLLKQVEDWQDKYNQLKTENEELNKKCNIYTCGICSNKENCNKLYKTLTEIKEIAEYEFKELMNAEDYHNMTEVLKQILQKISEVE